MTVIRNDADVEVYLPWQGVTLAPGESLTVGFSDVPEAEDSPQPEQPAGAPTFVEPPAVESDEAHDEHDEIPADTTDTQES